MARKLLNRKLVEMAIQGLHADGPDPLTANELSLFAQFIGDWDIVEARYPQPGGNDIIRKGKVHYGWVLGGKAIQDVWMVDKEDIGRTGLVGTTIRYPGPEKGTWTCVWIAPSQGNPRIFIARKASNEIILEGKTHDGRPERWIYFDMGPNSFRWRAVESDDHGRTWRLTEDMQVRRSPVSALKE